MIVPPRHGSALGFRTSGDHAARSAVMLAAAAALTLASCGDRAELGGPAWPGGPARQGDVWVNTLDMPFAPVTGLSAVHFAVWPRRVRDFRAFVEDTEHNDGYEYRAGAEPTVLKPDGWAPRGWAYGWEAPGFHQEDDHPVTCVSGEDAAAFCAWLTRLEQASGRIGRSHAYKPSCNTERPRGP